MKAGVSKNAVARKYGIHHGTVLYYLKKGGKTETKFWPEIKEIEIKEKKIKYNYEYRNTKKLATKNKKGKSYKELLAIENEKRKAKGQYLFKMPTAGFYK